MTALALVVACHRHAHFDSDGGSPSSGAVIANSEQAIAAEHQSISASDVKIGDIVAKEILPVVRNSKVIGAGIYGITPESVTEQIGLRDGDIVVRINDVDLSVAADGMMQPSLGSATTPLVSVDLIRDGKNLTITYTAHDD